MGVPTVLSVFTSVASAPTDFPSTLQILLNPLRTCTAPLAPLPSFPWREEGEEGSLRFQTLCYLGWEKGACFGAGKGRQKLHVSAFVSMSLEISPSRLHGCAERRDWPAVTPSHGRSPASLLAGCCSSLLCRGSSFQGQNCCVEVGVCDREWQAGPQFGVVIPES